jgi:hypothetical protein
LLTDGTAQGSAEYLIESGAAESAVIQVPAECRLLDVTIANRSAQLRRSAAGEVRIGLGPAELPQAVRMAFAATPGRSAKNRGQFEFAVPHLADAEVEQTLWTVEAPPAYGPARASSPSPSTAAELEAKRLRAAAAALATADRAAGLYSPDEVGQWYAPWGQRLRASSAALRRWLAIEPATAATAELKAGLPKLERAADAALAASASRNGDDPKRAASVESSDQSMASPFMHQMASYFVLNGAASRLPVDFPQLDRGDGPTRFAATFGVLLAGFVGAWAARRPAPSWLSWPILGVLAGLVWWLWMVPSIMGLGLVFACLAWAIRDKWRRQSVPPPLSESSASTS